MPQLSLTHLSGFGRGKSQTLNGTRFTFGREDSCDVRFDKSFDQDISPRHAEVSFENGECVLRDLGSATGVWLGGRRIKQESLPAGTHEIRLGNDKRFTLMVPVLEAPAVPRPAPAASAAHPTSFLSKNAVLVALGVTASLALSLVFIKQKINIGGNETKVTVVTESQVDTKTAAPAAPATGSVLAANSAAAPVPQPATAPAAASGVMLDSDEKLRLEAKKYEQAVGVVVVSTEEEGGDPQGTAWAVAPQAFATNAHITELLAEKMAGGASAFVVINKHPELRYRVRKVISHPKFYTEEQFKAGTPPRLNLDGKTEAVGTYDVGLILVEGELPVHMKLAGRSKLLELDSGHRVCYLGFPMENLKGNNIDVHYPVATMQSGIITSVTDAWMARATAQDAILIHHNLPSAGGASGSPVFDVDGDVVGLHSAGNYTMGLNHQVGAQLKAEARIKALILKKETLKILDNPKLSEQERERVFSVYREQLALLTGLSATELTRVTSASLINFAQRVDLLKELMAAHGIPVTEGK